MMLSGSKYGHSFISCYRSSSISAWLSFSNWLKESNVVVL